MIKVAFVNEFGRVLQIAVPGDDHLYSDGQTYGNLVARKIPFESSDAEYLKCMYWTGTEFSTLPARPNKYYFWKSPLIGWEPDIKFAVDSKWTEIKQDRDRAEYDGFTCDGSVYDSDPASVSRINTSVVMAMAAQLTGGDFSTEWKLKDNSKRVLSAAEMIQVSTALGLYVKSVHAYADTLRVQIESSSVDDIESIVWNYAP